MAFQGHYIGFNELEKMLDAIQPHGNVYANCIFESNPAQLAQMGMDTCSTIIQVSRIEGDVTYYWRWKIASVLLLASGEPFDPQKSRRARIAGESAWPAIHDWLKKKVFPIRVIEAASSMPRNMNFLGGDQPTFLSYDPTTARYSLRDEGVRV